ncbi:hypothetical protein N0V94_007641 [Neodidymelliopsis sp. IMI 364377]|nr:hypothetical protein N0V94_007641 [Neodidymelliopsis sp. IMI 364377]
MSDNDTNKTSWTDREVLVYLLSTIEYSNIKLDFINAPHPPGRNASGCAQKIGRVKKALKKEIEALKSGVPVSGAEVEGGKRKRKAESGEEDGKARKRGRARKVVEREEEEEIRESVEEVEDRDGGDEI